MAAALALAVLAWNAGPLGMAALRALIAVSFRDVPAVDTATLAAELAGPRPPLLLDAREASEYEVSHLPGARHAPPHHESGLAAELPRDARIVVYCSVGWRSAGLARRLQAAGFRDVRNLEGSAFAWANEGRALAGRLGSRGLVHPYASVFAWLLVPGARGPAS
jgi:rhodanese-related sulfurtransferase